MGESLLYCLVMELMDLGSIVDAFLEKKKRLPEPLIRHIAKSCLSGLKAMHDRASPLIHRDIKPHNILLSSKGDVRIADFGLMWKLESVRHYCDDSQGTVKYFSPERINQDFGVGCDIWSLGVTIVECTIGRLIFDHELTQVKILDGLSPLEFLDEVDGVSSELRDFIAKAVSPTADERWSAEQLLSHPFLQPNDESIARESLGGKPPNFDLVANCVQILLQYMSSLNYSDEPFADSDFSDMQRLRNLEHWTGVHREDIENYVNKLFDRSVNHNSRSRLSPVTPFT